MAGIMWAMTAALAVSSPLRACAAALHKVHTELSATERKVLLASVNGLSPAQTAKTLGTSPKSVANALARARRKLRGTQS